MTVASIANCDCTPGGSMGNKIVTLNGIKVANAMVSSRTRVSSTLVELSKEENPL